MEWMTGLRGTVVGLDTAPLIYFIEENPDYVSVVQPFFEAMDQGEFGVVTSVVTLRGTGPPLPTRGRCLGSAISRHLAQRRRTYHYLALPGYRRGSRTTPCCSQHSHARCDSDGRRDSRRSFVFWLFRDFYGK